jgi:ABC-2 type transport system ATP-binding protein
VLDEPISGLSLQSRRLVIETIHQMNEQGSTIFLTTHNIEEAKTLCLTVCIINKGKIVAQDSPKRLKKMFATTQSVEVSFDRTPGPVRDMPGTGAREIYKERYETVSLNTNQNSQYVIIIILIERGKI